MELKRLLLCSQHPSTGPYPEQDASSPHLSTIFTLRFVLASTSRSSELPISLRFSDQNFICISHLTPPCYMPRPSHSPGLIALIIFVEAYTLRSSLACSLLQSPATSCFLGPNILPAPCYYFSVKNL